jgi:hypothetical protein
MVEGEGESKKWKRMQINVGEKTDDGNASNSPPPPLSRPQRAICGCGFDLHLAVKTTNLTMKNWGMKMEL